jgi:hypothetical protein
MRHLRLDFGFKVKRQDCVVKETCSNVVSIGGGCDRDTKRFCAEKRLTLVGFQHTAAHFSLGEAYHELIVLIYWPYHACDRRILLELVANCFFLTPVGTQAVYKDNVI